MKKSKRDNFQLIRRQKIYLYRGEMKNAVLRNRTPDFERLL